MLRESPSKGKKILAFTYVERVAGAAVYEGYATLIARPFLCLSNSQHASSTSEVELQGIDQIDEPDREGIMRYVNSPPQWSLLAHVSRRKAFLFKLAPVGGWTHEDTVPITGSASRKRKPEVGYQSPIEMEELADHLKRPPSNQQNTRE